MARTSRDQQNCPTSWCGTNTQTIEDHPCGWPNHDDSVVDENRRREILCQGQRRRIKINKKCLIPDANTKGVLLAQSDPKERTAGTTGECMHRTRERTRNTAAVTRAKRSWEHSRRWTSMSFAAATVSRENASMYRMLYMPGTCGTGSVTVPDCPPSGALCGETCGEA